MVFVTMDPNNHHKLKENNSICMELVLKKRILKYHINDKDQEVEFENIKIGDNIECVHPIISQPLLIIKKRFDIYFFHDI